MLLPRFSIRLLLLLMVGVAIYATVATYAMRGNPWLIGIATGLGSLGFVALIYAGFFLLFSLLTAILPKRSSEKQAHSATLQSHPSPLPESQSPGPRPPVTESSR